MSGHGHHLSNTSLIRSLSYPGAIVGVEGWAHPSLPATGIAPFNINVHININIHINNYSYKTSWQRRSESI
jgi:hypothetical protein